MNLRSSSGRKVRSCSLLSLACAAVQFGWCDIRPACAQGVPVPGHEAGSNARAKERSNPSRGMYVDRSNNVRVPNTRRMISLDEATAELLQEGRTIRTNERFRRYPTDIDAERTERSEKWVAGIPRYTDSQPRGFYQVVRLSAEEEERELGHGQVVIGPYYVPPHRYSSRNYDPELARKGLERIEPQQENYQQRVRQLEVMRAELIEKTKLLESELRYRREFGSGRPKASEVAAGGWPGDRQAPAN